MASVRRAAARVAAGAPDGNPAIPTIDTDKARDTFGKPIGVSPGVNRFDYRQVATMLNLRKATLPLPAHMREDDEVSGLVPVVSALVGGQGKTEGLHRRRIPTSRIDDGDQFDPMGIFDVIGRVAQLRADDGYKTGRRLRRAPILMMMGGPDVLPDRLRPIAHATVTDRIAVPRAVMAALCGGFRPIEHVPDG